MPTMGPGDEEEAAADGWLTRWLATWRAAHAWKPWPGPGLLDLGRGPGGLAAGAEEERAVAGAMALA